MMRFSALGCALFAGTTVLALGLHTGLTRAAAAAVVVPDISVTTHEGRRVNLASGLMAGKAVAMHFMFPTCYSFCPVLGGVVAQAQQATAKHPQADRLAWISVSVMPAQSTPAKLAEWLSKLQARPGWTAVRVEQAQLAQLLERFGENAVKTHGHTSQVVVFDSHGKLFHRFDDVPEPDALARAMTTAIGATRVPAQSLTR